MPPVVQQLRLPQRQPKEGAFEKIMKGLQIAQGITGTVTNIANLANQGKMTEAEFLKQRLTEEQLGEIERNKAAEAKAAEFQRLKAERTAGVSGDAAPTQPQGGQALNVGLGTATAGLTQQTQPRPGVFSAKPVPPVRPVLIPGHEAEFNKEMKEFDQDKKDFRKEMTAFQEQQKAKREEAEQEQQRTQGKQNTANSVVNEIDEILQIDQQAILPTAGLAGSVLSHVPGLASADIDRKLDVVKANIMFDTLQRMREASKTGGALGQVSEREGKLLQSSVAALDNSLSPDEFKKSLLKVRDRYQRFLETTKGLDVAPLPGNSRTGGSTNPNARQSIIQADDIDKMSDQQLNDALFK